MTQEHDDDQDDGGASAYDRKKRRPRAAAAPMEQPNGCLGCARTGRRIVAGHDRSGETVDVHYCFCGCPLGQHLRAREGGRPFFEVRDAITASFRIAIVDPTPAQMVAGGAVVKPIPKLGDYVPRRAAFQLLGRDPAEYAPGVAARGYRFAVPPLTIAEARAFLGWPEEALPERPPPDPSREPRTAGLLPLAGDALATHRARMAAPIRPVVRPPSSITPVGTVRPGQALDLGTPAPEPTHVDAMETWVDRREIAPGGVPDGPDERPPWLDDDAQPPWLQ